MGEKVYGLVLFLRWKFFNGIYICILILVKVFVFLLKKKLIFCLEFMGCFLFVRVYKICKEVLEFVGISNCKRMFWIDF